MIRAAAAIFLAVLPPLAAPAAAQTEIVAETIIAKGGWTKASFKSEGELRIVDRGGVYFVVLDGAFSTRNAPDLKIFLSRMDAGEITGKNATEEAVLVAPLSSNKGAQEYRLPEGVDPADFASIIIHCEQYSKLWSVASL